MYDFFPGSYFFTESPKSGALGAGWLWVFPSKSCTSQTPKVLLHQSTGGYQWHHGLCQEPCHLFARAAASWEVESSVKKCEVANDLGDHFGCQKNMSSHAPLYEFIVMRVIPLLVILNTVQDLIGSRIPETSCSLSSTSIHWWGRRNSVVIRLPTLMKIRSRSSSWTWRFAPICPWQKGWPNKKHVGSNPGLNLVRDFSFPWELIFLLVHFRHFAESDGIPKVSPWSTGQCQTGRFRWSSGSWQRGHCTLCSWL